MMGCGGESTGLFCPAPEDYRISTTPRLPSTRMRCVASRTPTTRPPEKALAYIREEAGKHFDPQVVQAFLRWKEQA
jgi:hypothetical protein